MNNKKLREELQKIASDKDVLGHVRKIEEICAIYNCSIKVVREYEVNAKETFNCFEYALGLNVNVCIRIRRDLADFGVLVDCSFIDYLRQLGNLLEIDESNLEENDLIIYFWNLKVQHAGRWNNGRVTSKWGSGLLYNHDIYVVPVNYGDPRYFRAIQSDLAKKRLLEYARERGVREEYLTD